MTYTPQQRLAIASAFAAARLRMWDGHPSTTGEQFICLALGVSNTANLRAVEVVMKRLGGHYTIENYIKDVVGVTSDACTTQDVQGFRIRWLDSLIQEFTA